MFLCLQLIQLKKDINSFSDPRIVQIFNWTEQRRGDSLAIVPERQ
jgi:hypothetical protein